MSIDIISRDILQKANTEKDLIETEFSKEISILEENNKNSIDSFKEKLKAKYELDVSNQKEKILGLYRKESKKEILKVRNQLVKETYDEVFDELSMMKGEEKSKLLSSIINSAKKSGFKFEKIICSKKDSKIVKEIIEKEISITIIEDMEGLIFVAKSGKEILDMTFQTLLKEAFEKTESKIQKTLFNI